jgi:hypothetical protein
MAMGAYGLTLVAGIYVQHVIARVTGVYGPLAATIGLLVYVSPIVQLFVIATELNVVRAKDLWPRSLTGRALGTPDAPGRRSHASARAHALARTAHRTRAHRGRCRRGRCRTRRTPQPGS